MVKIKVVAGDVKEGAWEFLTTAGTARMSRPDTRKGAGLFARVEVDLKKDLTGIQQLDETSVRSLAGAAGWGFLGTVALGPLGLLGGALWGARARQQVTFAAELTDGRKFLATCDAKTWQKIHAAAWDKQRLVDPAG